MADPVLANKRTITECRHNVSNPNMITIFEYNGKENIPYDWILMHDRNLWVCEDGREQIDRPDIIRGIIY